MPRLLRWLLLAFLAVSPMACNRPVAEESPSPAPTPTAPQEQAGTIAWLHDYQAALALAEEEKKPIMMDVFATWCTPCKMLDSDVFSKAEIVDASKGFVCVKVDGDKNPDLREQLEVSGYPTVIFLDRQGGEIRRSIGLVSYTVMLREMEAAAEHGRAPQAESN